MSKEDEVYISIDAIEKLSKGRILTAEQKDIEDIKTVLLALLKSFVVYRRGVSFKPVEYIRYKGFEEAADILKRWENEKNENT